MEDIVEVRCLDGVTRRMHRDEFEDSLALAEHVQAWLRERMARVGADAVFPLALAGPRHPSREVVG